MSWRISTVAKEVGISPITLRAWERRYGFPSPERSDTNYRSYSDEEVMKLRRVVALIGHGLKVSEAVARVQGQEKAAVVSPAELMAKFFELAKALDQAGIDDI